MSTHPAKLRRGMAPVFPSHLPEVSTPVVKLTFSAMVSCATKVRARETAEDQSPSPLTGSICS